MKKLIENLKHAREIITQVQEDLNWQTEQRAEIDSALEIAKRKISSAISDLQGQGQSQIPTQESKPELKP